MSERCRFFAFTNFDKLDISYAVLLDSAKLSYLCYGTEICPTTGTVHHQGFAVFKNRTSYNVAVKKLPGHITVCNGTPEENIEYCSKDGSFLEFGERPKAQGARTDLATVFVLLRTNPVEHVMEHHPAIWARNYRAMQIYADFYTPPRNFVTQCFYLWGPPASGKSRYAFDAGAVAVVKEGTFLLGYKNQDKIVFEDVDNNNSFSRNFFNTLIDRYPLIINVKGGEAKFNSHIVYFTSNFPPEVSFPWYDESTKRRITEVLKFPLN